MKYKSVKVPDFSKSIHVQIKNNSSSEIKGVKLFSPDYEIPNDIVISIQNSKSDLDYKRFVEDLHESKSAMVMDRIIIHAESIDDFIHSIVIGNNSQRELLPILYFSTNQMVENSVHIYPFVIRIESGVSMTLNLQPNKILNFSFISAEDEGYEKKESVYGRYIPVLIENPTDEFINVKLFDENYNPDQSQVKISTTGGDSYSDLIKSLKSENGSNNIRETFSKINSLKIWSDNKNQFGRRWERGGEVILKELYLEEIGKEKIFSEKRFKPVEYFSPYQFQDHLLDIACFFKYTWNKECFIEIRMLPKTKAFYLFYELISDRERDIIEFEQQNKITLDRLRLKLVKE